MDVVFGTNSKGKQTVIYRNFEYVKECDNRCGTTSWHCQKFQSMQRKSRLLISGDRVEQCFFIFFLSDVILSQRDI